MNGLLADDPAKPVPSPFERAELDNEQWQAMRWRAFKRTDLHCERCQAEDNTRVLRYLYWDPVKWEPFVIGAPRRPDFYVSTIRLLVVPTALPWSGEESELEVLCVSCWLFVGAERARAARQKARTDLRGQLALL